MPPKTCKKVTRSSGQSGQSPQSRASPKKNVADIIADSGNEFEHIAVDEGL